jgi:hypothetical protein
MKRLLRGVFLGLAALTVAAQAQRLAADIPAAEETTLQAGLAALGLRPVTPALPDTLAVAAPGCADPVVLANVHVSGLGRDTARTLLDLPAEPRFVYLGFVGARADTVAIAARWAAASVLHAIAPDRGSVPLDVVLVMLPSACPALARLDWSRLSPWR